MLEELELEEEYKDVLKTCPKHKRYLAKQKPRTNCEGCWRVYIDLYPEHVISPIRWEFAVREKFIRKRLEEIRKNTYV